MGYIYRDKNDPSWSKWFEDQTKDYNFREKFNAYGGIALGAAIGRNTCIPFGGLIGIAAGALWGLRTAEKLKRNRLKKEEERNKDEIVDSRNPYTYHPERDEENPYKRE